MHTTKEGVVTIVLEWALSVIILLGGGYMLFQGKSEEFVISALTLVITFWFNRRQSEQNERTITRLTEQVTPQEQKTVNKVDPPVEKE